MSSASTIAKWRASDVFSVILTFSSAARRERHHAYHHAAVQAMAEVDADGRASPASAACQIIASRGVRPASKLLYFEIATIVLTSYRDSL